MTGRLGTVLARGYRAFFLLAGLFGVLAMSVWALGIAADDTPPLPPHWHAHEMIFGYATAAIAGFFLTAAPAWTGGLAARRTFIAAGALLWLSGRLAVGLGDQVGPTVAAAADLAFLPFIAAKVIAQLARRPKPQNMMLVGLLGIVWTANLFFHLGAGGLLDGGVAAGLRGGLLGIASIIAVIGGRVVPAFTRNAMRRDGIESRLPRSRRVFEIPGIALPIALAVLQFVPVPAWLIGGVALLAGVAQLLRLLGWRTPATLGQPILWSLHLGFGMLAAGYLLFGLALLGVAPEIAALHVLGIGAVGGMTLAVMSRAILGHSGRPLVAPGRTALAYLLVATAAAIRATAELAGDLYPAMILASAILWIIAFLFFVADIWPIVTDEDQPDPAGGT